jgi:DNA-binding transcriptional regulator YiaG
MEIRTDPSRLSAYQIRYLIQELGLSQERFAAHIGSTRATVWHWVNGRRAPSHMACKMMRLVADEFAISIPGDQELAIEAV